MNYQFYNIRQTIRFLKSRNYSMLEWWNIIKQDRSIRINSIIHYHESHRHP